MVLRLENGHVLSLERQKRRKLGLLLAEKNKKKHNMENGSKMLPGEASDKERNTDQLSPSPNRFVSENFELSFEIPPLLDLDMTIPSRLIIHRNGPYPTLCLRMVANREYPLIKLILRRMDGEGEPTIVEPLLTPPGIRHRFKVPWRGKNIIAPQNRCLSREIVILQKVGTAGAGTNVGILGSFMYSTKLNSSHYPSLSVHRIFKEYSMISKHL